MRFFVNYIATSLMLLALAVSSVFAQTDNIPFQKVRIADESINKASIKSSNQAKQTRAENILWSCDFENNNYTLVEGNDDASGKDHWQIVTLSTFPSTLVTSTGAYFKPFIYRGDTLNDTPEHWAMVDLLSDNAQFGGTGQVAEKAWIQFQMNLSNSTYPKICFKQLYRPLNSVSSHIKVSVDDGSSWTDHLINNEVASNDYGDIYKEVIIQEAAGSSNVIIRFQQEAAGTGLQGYGWQIDDIKITEAHAFDLVITDVRMNDGRCDYYSNRSDFPNLSSNYYQYQPMFGQTPYSEWTNNLKYASFNIVVENRGYESITPFINIKITDPNGTIVFDDTITSPNEIGAFERDTIDFIEITDDNNINHIFRFVQEQTPNITIGEYNVTYIVYVADNDDPTPDNNTTTEHFYITENTYCPATPNITTTSGPNIWTNFVDGDEIFVDFTYYTLLEGNIPLYVYISENTTPGTAIGANVYEPNEETSDYILTKTSGTYTISQNDLGKWVEIPFEIPLSNIKSVRIGIAFYQNGFEELHLGASNDMPNKGWICKYTVNGSEPSTINAIYESVAPAICLGDPPRTAYTITVLSANESRGYVSGGGTFANGTQTTISATPYDGYRFTSWNDGNIENPRTITVNADATFIATFAPCPIYEVDTAVNYVLTHNGHTYYADGDYEFVYPNETGCDSIVMMHLHIIYSVDEYEIIEATIFPNPVDNILNITSQENISAVEILSVAGQLLLSLKSDSQNVVCDVNNLTQGIYFVKIYGADGKIPAIKKFVKE